MKRLQLLLTDGCYRRRNKGIFIANDAWIELHRDELLADWELAVNGEMPYKIDPL